MPFTMLLQSHLECCVQFWDTQLEKLLKALKCIHRMATKLVKWLESMSFEKHLRTLGLSDLEKSGLRDEFLALYSFLGKDCKGRCWSLLPGLWCQDMRMA